MSSEILEFSTSFKDNKKEKSDFLRVINKVCCNCRLCNDCWKYNYKATEKTLLQCKNIISNNGDKREEVNNILSKFNILIINEERKSFVFFSLRFVKISNFDTESNNTN